MRSAAEVGRGRAAQVGPGAHCHLEACPASGYPAGRSRPAAHSRTRPASCPLLCAARSEGCRLGDTSRSTFPFTSGG